MNRMSKTIVGLLIAGFAFLVVDTKMRADDKKKTEPGKPGPASPAPSDAGVPLYQSSAALNSINNSAISNREAREKAEAVLKRKDASKEEKAGAEAELKRIQEVEKLTQD